MGRLNIAISVLVLAYLVMGCEGAFDTNDENPDPIGMDTPIQITLLEPPNLLECLTQGDDGFGNWVVEFNWSVTPEFDGNFTIVLTENGNPAPSESLSPGGVLTLSPNTLYTWQIQADGREEESEIFTFVTPAPPGDSTAPPVISTILVTENGGGYRISCTVLDSDLNEVQLFVDGSPIGPIYTEQGEQVWQVNDLAPNAEIRVVATDNSGHTTEQVRRFGS